MALAQLDAHQLSRTYQRTNRFVVLMLRRWLPLTSQLKLVFSIPVSHLRETVFDLCNYFCDWLVIFHCHIYLCVVSITMLLQALSCNDVTDGSRVYAV